MQRSVNIDAGVRHADGAMPTCCLARTEAVRSPAAATSTAAGPAAVARVQQQLAARTASSAATAAARMLGGAAAQRPVLQGSAILLRPLMVLIDMLM